MGAADKPDRRDTLRAVTLDEQGNEGCAQPIATFGGVVNGNENLDPRMLMPIQRAFIQ